jgi:hypothetical protein
MSARRATWAKEASSDTKMSITGSLVRPKTPSISQTQCSAARSCTRAFQSPRSSKLTTNGEITGTKAKPSSACEVDMKVGDMVETIAGNRVIILKIYPKQKNEFSQHCKIYFLKTGVLYDGYNMLKLRRAA